MELFELLKQLKLIEPDAEYTKRSRRAILGMPVENLKKPFSVRSFLMQSLETSSTIALAGLLVLLVVGGFSLARFLSPVGGLRSLDPVSLRAEAHVVDLQIELNNLTYTNPPQPGTAQGTTALSSEIEGRAKTLGISIPHASSAVDFLSIDAALEKLGE